MRIVLTICSANYLAGAKVLGDSILKENPDYHFVIGLVDRLPADLDPAYWRPFELIPVEELAIPDFQELVRKYDLVELNTLVKPFYIDFLYRRNAAVGSVIYLDPDILVLGGFRRLEAELERSSLILTPHSSNYDNSPENFYFERSMLSTGIYNLGFLATARSEVTEAFLKWWQERLRRYCFYDPRRGLFVDQIWMNLAPIYFPNLTIEKGPGYNMAYWNLFERRLSRENGRFKVNDHHDLVFFHFSGYNPLDPELISRRRPLTLANRPDLRPLFEEYRSALLAGGYVKLKDIQCCFTPTTKPIGLRKLRRLVGRPMKSALRRLLPALPRPCRQLLSAMAQFTEDNCRVSLN